MPPGSSSPTLTTRFGRVVNGQFDPMIAFGGPTLQAKGIGPFKGFNFVGEVVPTQATIVAHRRTIPLFGLGLVDAIPDQAIVTLSAQQHSMSPATAGVVSTTVDPDTGPGAGRPVRLEGPGRLARRVRRRRPGQRDGRHHPGLFPSKTARKATARS